MPIPRTLTSSRHPRTRNLDRVHAPVGAEISGRLVRRYKRFFADVEIPGGEILTVHCPNPGSMRGCATPGAAVRCSTSDNPHRKLRHTLEMIRDGRIWVGLHTLRANQLVARALAAGAKKGTLTASSAVMLAPWPVSGASRTPTRRRMRSSPEEAVLLVDPWTLKEIIDGVLQPGNEPTLQENLRRRALDRAHSFRWGAEKARKTMKIYESAVGGGRRCPGGPRLPEGQQP